MRWIWIQIWLILLVIQIALYGVKTALASPVPEMPIPPGREYLELARETNRTWGMLLDSGTGARLEGSGGLLANGLMEREEWLMRLQELQSGLSKNGHQVQLVEDLESWLSVGQKVANNPGNRQVNNYLRNLHGWLDSLKTADVEVRVNRIRLEPGIGSDFPYIYFEMEGTPLPMGQALVCAAERGSCWQVQEIDLYCDDIPNTWWMQGSCAYDPEGHQ